MSTEMEKVILATKGDQEQTPPSEDPKTRKQKDRRAWLKKGLAVTMATVGAALLGTRADTAHAQPNAKVGVKGQGSDIGVEGTSASANGVGVAGYNPEFIGVVGYSPKSIGVVASSPNGLAALQIEGRIRLVGGSENSPWDSPFGRFFISTTGVASATVSNPFVEPDSIVLLTPLGDPGGPVWVTGTTKGSFVVNRGGTLPAFGFDYLIINLGKKHFGPKVPW